MNFYNYGYGLYKEDVYKQPITDIENRVMGKRSPDIEHIIKKNPSWALWYAEHAICEAYCVHARKVIRGRWLVAEPYIMKDSGNAFCYAESLIRGRWVGAEIYIMTDPYWAMEYTHCIIGGRWVEAEPYIMKDPMNAYLYARDIFKERWVEAERYIKEDQYWWGQYKEVFKI